MDKKRNNRLKILILTHRFYPDVGGIETNSEILASAFSSYNAEVRVITWTKHNKANDFPFAVIRHPSLLILIKAHIWADVVFENNPCLRLSWLNFIIQRPLVIAVNTWVNRIKGNKGWRDKLKNLWFKRADNVIAVSEALRKKEWPAAFVIENPYDDQIFNTNNNVPRNKHFAFLGRLVSDKGADQAMKAVFDLIQQKLLDKDELQLTIVGDGPERGNLIDMRERLNLYGNIQFTGILKGKALVDCLNEHQFLLIPSCWEEPYGNVALEGLACGCIPIASNGGGLPEAIGNAGVLFQRNNQQDLVEKIADLIDHPSKKEVLKQAAPKHLQLHTKDAVAQRYFAVIKQAALQH